MKSARSLPLPYSARPVTPAGRFTGLYAPILSSGCRHPPWLPRENDLHRRLAYCPTCVVLCNSAAVGLPKDPAERKWRIYCESGSICRPNESLSNTLSVRDATCYRRGKLRQVSSLHCNLLCPASMPTKCPPLLRSFMQEMGKAAFSPARVFGRIPAPYLEAYQSLLKFLLRRFVELARAHGASSQQVKDAVQDRNSRARSSSPLLSRATSIRARMAEVTRSLRHPPFAHASHALGAEAPFSSKTGKMLSILPLANRNGSRAILLLSRSSRERSLLLPIAWTAREISLRWPSTAAPFAFSCAPLQLTSTTRLCPGGAASLAPHTRACQQSPARPPPLQKKRPPASS